MPEVIPPVTGVLETSLYVEDVARSAEFYGSLFGFEILIQDNRFCALSVVAKQVLLLFRKGGSTSVMVVPGGVIPAHDGGGQSHLAFSISASELPAWEARLGAQNIAIESTVAWPRGGRSIYFRDPDSHLVELVTPGCWQIY